MSALLAVLVVGGMALVGAMALCVTNGWSVASYALAVVDALWIAALIRVDRRIRSQP